jgi:hypothetical protein
MTMNYKSAKKRGMVPAPKKAPAKRGSKPRPVKY